MLCGVGCAVCSSWESHSPMYYYYTSTHAIGSPPPFISPPPLLLLLRYTFGPTFRAEQSHGTRHLAEFHMVRRKKMKREKRREEKRREEEAEMKMERDTVCSNCVVYPCVVL